MRASEAVANVNQAAKPERIGSPLRHSIAEPENTSPQHELEHWASLRSLEGGGYGSRFPRGPSRRTIVQRR